MYECILSTLYTPLKNAHNMCTTVSCWNIFGKSYKYNYRFPVKSNMIQNTFKVLY